MSFSSLRLMSDELKEGDVGDVGGGGRGAGAGEGGGGGAHRLEDEHAIVRAQQLSDQQLEELLLHAASINAVLPDEVDPQGLEHIPGLLPGYLIQSVLHHLN